MNYLNLKLMLKVNNMLKKPFRKDYKNHLLGKINVKMKGIKVVLSSQKLIEDRKIVDIREIILILSYGNNFIMKS